MMTGQPMALRDLPAYERPRERLLLLGPSALSNQELVAAILGTGSRAETVTDVSRRILSSHGLEGLSGIGVPELGRNSGIGRAKACRLVAAVELGKRVSLHASDRGSPIRSACQIAGMFMPRMRGLRKERLECVYLNSNLRHLGTETVSVGGLNTNHVSASDVFRQAVVEAAAAVVLVHNHPSGNPEPSRDDIAVTRRLGKAGKLLGIEVLDHIIIGGGAYVSLKEANLF